MAHAGQVAFRRLENGDFLRVLVDSETHVASLYLGEADADEDGRETVTYGWAMDLSAIGLAELQTELCHVAVAMAKLIDSSFNQTKDEVSNLRAARAQS